MECDAITPNYWIDMTREYHITIEYLKNLVVGEKYNFLCLDRNFLDICSNEKINEYNKIFSPEYFFRNNYFFEYIHDNNMTGKGCILFSDELNKNIYTKEFEIEYATERWFPLYNGKLDFVVYDYMDIIPDKYKVLHGKNWHEFPETTRIGWRGPMIPVEKLKLCPNLINLLNI